MKLYYSTGACSLSPHIVMRELGMEPELLQVNLRTGQFHGEPFSKINPKGYVPVLELDNGEVLTEGAVIVQYLADQKPAAKLLPAVGTMERYRCQEWLTYISSELHKGFSPLFSPTASEEAKQATKEQIGKKLDLVERQLAKTPYLMGDNFSVADAYLFTVLSWSAIVRLELEPWPSLKAFLQRMKSRPAVQAALKAEGLK